ncbi:ABC transporter substrate-binding protein [Streptomyces sp. NPDC057445]|uniref:ABC transporter substrate-binding protein n=1 Tax=Streptomyces sp. NPDC057445 TaxID=3346136 RepID=UPI0036CE8404
MPYVVASRRRTLRSVALFTGGVLALPVLAGCSTAEPGADHKPVPMDIGLASRDVVADGGTLRWAVDAMPTTLNTFQADADAATSRVVGAVLPSLFTMDERGRPQRNPDYLESAEVVDTEPKQVVLYKLKQQAVWSDGREIGAPDFVAQWRALSGKDSAYWTARNAGYDRIEKIERGANDLEVRVTFAKPYADWQSLFTPLYPKDVMGTPTAFNDDARGALASTAGPFRLQSLDQKAGTVTLARNPRWWGQPAKLDSLVLRAVPRDQRAAALATGTVDLAEIDRAVADRIALAVRDGNGQAAAHGPGTAASPAAAVKSLAKAYGSDEDQAEAIQLARGRNRAAIAHYATEQIALRAFVVRKSLEPAYTQLALNGESGPLSDERVRRAVARALNRQELAEVVLKPLGLPAYPVGSHLALAGQPAYADSSGALGGQDTEEAQALLADAGWTPEGARKKAPDGTKAGAGADADTSPAAPSPAATGPAAKSPAADAPAVGSGSPAASSPAAPATPGGPAVSTPAPAGPDAQSPDAQSPAAQSPDAQSLAPATPAPASPAAGNLASGSEGDSASDEGLYVVGDGKPGDAVPGREAGWNILAPARTAALQRAALRRQADALDGPDDHRAADFRDDSAEADGKADADGKQHGVAGAYAPIGTRAPAPAHEQKGSARGPLGKDGEPLTLRFVLPSGPGSEALRTVGDRIARMLDRVGIRTEVTKVADESYFKDHVASGEYDLALYSWPATAYPATDARPIFAKPLPASDGSLLVEQNYTRVGTDHIDQLFAQAVAELDAKEALDLMKKADARIWAAAGSIPLYQRPQLVAVKRDLVNAGAFGFATPRYQDIGFKRSKTTTNDKN